MLFNYDLLLILLAMIIASLAFYVSFWLCKAGARKKHYCWPLFSGPTMGCGIWVLHYMVMQAHPHSHAISYNIKITLASLLLAVIGCTLGFGCLLFKKLRKNHYIIPAVIFSAAAASMHYLGMAAIINISGRPVSSLQIILSLIVIFVTSLLMLRLTHLMLVMANKNDSYANSYRLGATVTLCTGVALMHFIGTSEANMSSMVLSPVAGSHTDHIENTIAMTMVILIALVFIMAIFIWFVNFKKHLSNELLKRELIAKNLQLKQMTQHDSLTQLPNRLYLQNYLNMLFKSQITPLFIMFIDLDGFKRVNDVWGHAVGDELLVSIAHALRSVVGSEGFVARIGGDEFIIVVNQQAKEAVIRLAQEILTKISVSYHLSATKVDFISASIGIAVYPEHGRDVATLLKKADVAMYYIKDRGKNNIIFYNEIEMTLPM
ncbi:diguanylate cyclase [Buttiauxella warmboldiae]|uniref:Diguanylate cyclase n=1 Tax=Buttiauxella warmboldiae TaxID=82993 RepID=A0A3N5D3B2_9ENTR|nr:diguanylate cyclase [Buttiauxella warmboldiae]RPH22193.1 diguanylate cyclase [Buttiauxella warmboldiae]